MGYDIYAVKLDTSKDAEFEQNKRDIVALDLQITQAREAGDHIEVQRLHNEQCRLIGEQDAFNLNYFRFNIGGMFRMVDTMKQLGMVANNYVNDRDWPKLDDFEGLTDENLDEMGFWDLEPDQRCELSFKPAQDYARALKKHVEWSPADIVGIPVHKFGTNDGWHVTPVELTGALAMYDSASESSKQEAIDGWSSRFDVHGRNYFLLWLDFLRRMEKLDGFTVH